MLPPERAFCPLWPLPLVFPWPELSPPPSRLTRCFDPGRGFNSCNRILVNLVRTRFYESKYVSADRRIRRKRWLPDFFTSKSEDILASPQSSESFDGGFNHVGMVAGSERLSQYIFDSGCFIHRPHSAS